MWYYYWHPESESLWKQNYEQKFSDLCVEYISKNQAFKISKELNLEIETETINLNLNKMSEQKTLNGTIALDRLIHVVMDKKGKGGKTVRGLFIPIEQNLLEVDDYGTHLPIRIIYKPEQDDKGQNGFITKAIGSKTYKAASKEQQEAWKDYKNEDTKAQTKILGNIKDWSSGSANSGAASDKVLSEDDDLPF